ncbi:MAG TPA: hypothetical protein VEF72_00080 [Mycobacterium sp.]|nr:hypothetical protein [Mycobacterium sp.]
MQRRRGLDDPPEQLLRFDGTYTSAAAWEAAFERWTAARAAWEADHNVVLPQR